MDAEGTLEVVWDLGGRRGAEPHAETQRPHEHFGRRHRLHRLATAANRVLFLDQFRDEEKSEEIKKPAVVEKYKWGYRFSGGVLVVLATLLVVTHMVAWSDISRPT